MAILNILHFPDPRLRTKAKPVSEVTPEINKILNSMLQTMYDAPGVGLAATQVNIHQRLVVIDVSEEKNQPIKLINPQIISKTGTEESEEGCLSVPGYFEKVTRAEAITYTALDEQGKQYTKSAEGFLAVCIQHELDHLDGKLFVDYLSKIKVQRLRKKIMKETTQK